jgi:hypothetical protein
MEGTNLGAKITPALYFRCLSQSTQRFAIGLPKYLGVYRAGAATLNAITVCHQISLLMAQLSHLPLQNFRAWPWMNC